MRRVGYVVVGVLSAGTVVLAGAVPAGAAPTPTPPPATPGEAVCTVTDPRLIELSGIVALPDGGYVVENDSNDQASAMRVTYLDSKCRPTGRVIGYPSTARDPEDLAMTPDGSLWVADIGDNVTGASKDRRQTIALWRIAPGSQTPVIHRLAYPDGVPHDAEALLFGPGDTPVIVTKEASGVAGIYQASAPLQANNKEGVPLAKVGEFKPQHTGTPNLLSGPGNILVTGAATSPDRKRIALRTYSDAYEWDVPDGDVVKAITTGKPRVTPLPNEPMGEGIAYSPDGAYFLTCSDQSGPTKILRYKPAAAAAPAATTKKAEAADSRPWYKKLSLPQIIDIVAVVGVLGLLLVLVGVLGIFLSRRSRRRAADAPTKEPAAKGSAEAPSRPGESRKPASVLSGADFPPGAPTPPAVPRIAPSSVPQSPPPVAPGGPRGAVPSPSAPRVPPPPSFPRGPAPGGGNVYGSPPPAGGPGQGGVYGSGRAQPEYGAEPRQNHLQARYRPDAEGFGYPDYG